MRQPYSREIVQTIVRHAILTGAQKVMQVACLVSVLLLAGCTTVITPQGQQYQVVNTGYSVVNNTGLMLDVVQDGVTISTGLATGQVLPLRNPIWRHKTVVTVLGHDATGGYVGTATWTFVSETPEAWTVTRLASPKESR